MFENKEIKNQHENQRPEKKEDESSYGVALGLCFGVALGMSFGQLVLHNMMLGMCMGIGIGLCLGTAYEAFKNKQNTDGTAENPKEGTPEEKSEPEEQKPESGEE